MKETEKEILQPRNYNRDREITTETEKWFYRRDQGDRFTIIFFYITIGGNIKKKFIQHKKQIIKQGDDGENELTWGSVKPKA